MTRAQLDKQPAQVSAMFDDVAAGYDRTRAVLWLGQMRVWGQATRRALGLRAGQSVLDVACGTGTSSRYLAKSGARVTGCDFSERMLAVARTRVPGVEFVFGDALALPFESDSFDAVTISFGLRNIADIDAALSEMRRVTRPGGRLVVCEYSHAPNPVVHAVSVGYMRRVAPVVAKTLSSDPAAYSYLAESIAAWPDQEAMAGRLQKAGWQNVAWRNLTAGMVALHRGDKP